MPYDPKDPADVAAVQELIDAALEPLAAKNKQLLGEVKTLKKGATVDPEEHSRLEQERDDLAAKLAEANKAATKAAKDAETANKALADETGRSSKLLIDNSLTAALTEAGVTDPAYRKAAAAFIRENGPAVKDGAAFIGDKPMSDFVKEWSQSDDGKAFVTAPNNSGGGAPGAQGKQAPAGNIAGTPAERAAAFASKHPELANN